MYDEILETADFEAFLTAYDYETDADPLEIDWEDIYRHDPDVADAALEREDATLAALRDASGADAVAIHNRPPIDAGDIVFKDGTATTCPDCRGEVEYQNRVAVLCTDCGAQFDHYYSSVRHELCTTGDDGDVETVATAPVGDREIRTDGGQPQLPNIRDLSREEMALYHLVESDARTFYVATGHEGQLTLTEPYEPKWETYHMPEGTTAEAYGGAADD